MPIRSYDRNLGHKEIQLRVLPPKVRSELIESTSQSEVSEYGRADVPFGLIEMFNNRLHEINRENLDPYEHARIQIVEGNVIEAETRLEAALKQGDERACANLGILKETRGDVQKARKLYERGKDSSSKNSLGNYYAKKKEYGKARKTYQEAINLAAEENNPIAGAILINAGKVFAQIGYVPAALTLFGQATTLGYFEGYMEAYNVAVQTDNLELVRSVLYQGSRVCYGPAILQSAILLLEKGEEQKAKDMFDLAENLGYTLNDEQKKIILAVRSRANSIVPQC